MEDVYSGTERERPVGEREMKRVRESKTPTRDDQAITRQRRHENLAERERERDLDAIKQHYLGSTKPKKKVLKPSDKSRFSSSWDNSDDTSCAMDLLYHHPRPLFGTGFIAGIDRIHQKKHNKLLTEEVNTPWSDKKLEEMTERDWRIFKEDFDISYKGVKVPKPIRNWDESRLSSDILNAVKRAGYDKPSPIQMAAIPLGLQQRDVIGVAQTGSGKTAAFLLPLLSYVSNLPPVSENESYGPYALVLAPTRELAQQIHHETVKLARYLGIRVVSVVGGLSILEQGDKISQGCEIIIATPGRLLDCLERRYCSLNQCNYVVLDEADRMIDMGFEPQIVEILEAMPSSNMKPENEDEKLGDDRIYRTTYMFSATMPPAVERLARKFLRNPVTVNIGTPGKATELITQNVIMVKESEKYLRLQRLLSELGDSKAIVFVNTRRTVDILLNSLEKAGYRALSLHGGKSQDQREISLDKFRKRSYNVLVATDVAGRGIDIPDVAHVINYDMPSNIQIYTHRIGRTGRAGKSGVATTFLTLSDTDVFYDLKQMLIQSNCSIPPQLARHEASKSKPVSFPCRPPKVQ